MSKTESKTKNMDKLPPLPDKPGVYIMHDSEDRVLYVGKAKSLKKRVRSYFRQEIDDPKTRALMGQFHHLEYLVTDSEKEALILEANLIKKYLPRYNVRLKDDKRYPYLKITKEAYPRLIITRRYQDDGAEYYGPYTDVKAVRRIIKFLKPLFLIRDCKRMDGPCLNYQIKLCPAPCGNKISQSEYHKLVSQVRLFLKGRYSEIKKIMQQEMKQSSKNHEFEKAAVIRDQLNSLDKILERQKMELNRKLDQDVIGYAFEDEMVVMIVFSLREGKIMSKEDFIMEGIKIEDQKKPENILSAFLKQYFSGPRHIPPEILVPISPDEESLIMDWLTEKRGEKVTIRVPETNLERSMVRMVSKNAEIIKEHQQEFRGALLDLKGHLKIPQLPRHIEAFDISNISGKMAVGSMVVFEDGKAKKNRYRRYKIQTPGPDDYAMMRELLTRRYKNIHENDQPLPDLILIDGGRGQLNVAIEVLESLKIDTGIIGLAKEYEHVFVPKVSTPIILPRSSPALKLLQRIRDEAHRFAINYHKKLRSKDLSKSILDEIPGIGPQRKKTLLNHFNDIKSLQKASIKEISEVKGINYKLATQIHQYLHNNSEKS